MKKSTLLFAIVLFTLVFISNVFSVNNFNETNKIQFVDTKVYVCLGKYAEKFHSRNDCRGLNNCKGGIGYYDSQEAALSAGFDYCAICWKY